MRDSLRLAACGLALLVAAGVGQAAYDDIVLGQANNSKVLEVKLIDSSTGGGKTGVAYTAVTASYVREGGTRSAIALAAGSAGDAFSSGKWAEVDATNCKGLYQLHVPDAALAAGVKSCTITLQATGVIDTKLRILIMGSDLRAAALAANATQINGVSTSSVTTISANLGSTQPLNFNGTGATAYVKTDPVQINGTALTARDIGSSVLLSQGTGAGQVNLSSGNVFLASNQHVIVDSGTVTTVSNAVTLTAAYDAAKTPAPTADQNADAVMHYEFWTTPDAELSNLAGCLQVYNYLLDGAILPEGSAGPRFSARALSLAPTGSGVNATDIATAVWGYDLAGQWEAGQPAYVMTALEPMIEFSAGHPRYTALALANAPAGEGGGSNPLASTWPGSYAPDSFAAWLAGRLNSPEITIVSTVAKDGTITLQAGDDYPAGHPIPLSRSWSDVDVTGYTARLWIRAGTRGAAGTTTGTVTHTLNNGVLSVAIVLTHAQTAALIPSGESGGPFTYQYQVVLTSPDGSVIKSPFNGTLKVVRGIAN